MSISSSMSLNQRVELTPQPVTSKQEEKFISSTERFAQLLQEYHFSVPSSSQHQNFETSPVESNEPLFTDAPQDIFGYHQQLQEQLQAIHSRLESIHNSAQRTTTNMERLDKDIKENLPENKAFLDNLQQHFQSASKLKGENLFVLESLRYSINTLNPYVMLINQLHERFSHFKDLLNTIESSTDLIFADIENDTLQFLNSLNSNQILHNFDPSKKSIQNLLEKIKDSNVSFACTIQEMKKSAEHLESALNNPPSINIHPAYKNITLDQKRALKTTVDKNIEFLNLNIVLIPTFDKTLEVIKKQLELLQDFISQIESQNNRYLQQILAEKNPSQRKQITINGQVINNSLNPLNALSLKKV